MKKNKNKHKKKKNKNKNNKEKEKRIRKRKRKEAGERDKVELLQVKQEISPRKSERRKERKTNNFELRLING